MYNYYKWIICNYKGKKTNEKEIVNQEIQKSEATEQKLTYKSLSFVSPFF